MSVSAFADAFQRIVGWLHKKRRAQKIVANLANGATPTELDAAEAAFGFPLGDALRAMWSVHAGQRAELDGFVASYDLLSIDRAIEATKFLRGLISTTRELPDCVPESGLTAEELASTRWVMFAARDFDGLAVNTTSGRVFQIRHDDAPPLHFVAPSLFAWISDYAAHVVAGDYQLEEGFGDYHLSLRDREAEAREKANALQAREETQRKAKLLPRTRLEEAIAKNQPWEAQSILENALGSKKVDFAELITVLFSSAPAPAFVADTLRTMMNKLTLTAPQWLIIAEGGQQLGNNAIHSIALSRSKTAT